MIFPRTKVSAAVPRVTVVLWSLLQGITLYLVLREGGSKHPSQQRESPYQGTAPIGTLHLGTIPKQTSWVAALQKVGLHKPWEFQACSGEGLQSSQALGGPWLQSSPSCSVVPAQCRTGQVVWSTGMAHRAVPLHNISSAWKIPGEGGRGRKPAPLTRALRSFQCPQRYPEHPPCSVLAFGSYPLGCI